MFLLGVVMTLTVPPQYKKLKPGPWRTPMTRVFQRLSCRNHRNPTPSSTWQQDLHAYYFCKLYGYLSLNFEHSCSYCVVSLYFISFPASLLVILISFKLPFFCIMKGNTFHCSTVTILLLTVVEAKLFR